MATRTVGKGAATLVYRQYSGFSHGAPALALQAVRTVDGKEIALAG